MSPQEIEQTIDSAFFDHLKVLFENLTLESDRAEAEKRFQIGFSRALDSHTRALRAIKPEDKK